MSARNIALGLMAAVAATLAGAPAAIAAGSYQVSACDYANGTNNSWAWSTTDQTHYASHANCPYTQGGDGGTADQEGGLSSTDVLGASSGAAPGSSAGWAFTAPSGTTITAIEYERYLGHDNDTSNTWSPALLADGAIVPGETCTVSLPDTGCFVGSPPPADASNTVDITGLSAQQLVFGETCQAPSGQTCVTGASEHNVWAAMYGATVTLSDTTTPTLGSPSGVLWGPGPYGGYHKGSESVTVSAQDAGGGVQSIVLAADGQPIETHTSACDFTFAQPCPLSTGAQTLTLPTTQLSDGTHALTLIAYDAAGNASATASEQVTIDNTPPPAPEDLAATPTQPGATTFNVTWTNPSGDVAPIAGANYQVCAASGSGGCPAAGTSSTSGAANVSVPGPGSWVIAVWLTDQAGNSNPANAARVTVTVPSTGGGSGSGGGSGGGSSGGGGGSSGGGSGGGTKTSVKLHVTEALRGRELRVHVTGPKRGALTIRYDARLSDRIVAHAVKVTHLSKGSADVRFTLGPITAARATIVVAAQIDHQTATTSTLKRARRR